MSIKQCTVVVLSLIVVLVGVLAACAGPAPTPTLTPTVTPTLTPTSVPGPLAQVIEGAKKEGTVSVQLRTGFTPKSIERMQKEIKDRFGVDLKINYTPSGNMPTTVANAIMEYKAGAAPSFELITIGPDHALPGLREGIFELADWKSLITPDTNPEAVVSVLSYGQLSVSSFNTLEGIMYNPEKVRPEQVPQTVRDLADPKWKGRVGIANYAALWTAWSFYLGKDKTFADLRAILKSGAIQGRFVDIYNRYLLGEISIALVGDSYYKMALDKGMPGKWQNLEMFLEASRPQPVLKGAPHPNAAKLVAIYLATPAGTKFTLEESGAGNLLYPGNFSYDIIAQAKQQGLPEFHYSDTRLLEFLQTAEEPQWEAEINAIFRAGA